MVMRVWLAFPMPGVSAFLSAAVYHTDPSTENPAPSLTAAFTNAVAAVAAGESLWR